MLSGIKPAHARLSRRLSRPLFGCFRLVAVGADRLQVVVPVHLVAPPLAARALCLAYDVIHLSGQRDMAGLVARLAQSSVASHHPRPELAPRCAIPSLSVRAPGVVFRPSTRLALVGVAVAMRGARQRCAPAMQTWTVGALWHAAPSIRRPFGLPRGRARRYLLTACPRQITGWEEIWIAVGRNSGTAQASARAP